MLPDKIEHCIVFMNYWDVSGVFWSFSKCNIIIKIPHLPALPLTPLRLISDCVRETTLLRTGPHMVIYSYACPLRALSQRPRSQLMWGAHIPKTHIVIDIRHPSLPHASFIIIRHQRATRSLTVVS